jgi:hypothetical protein
MKFHFDVIDNFDVRGRLQLSWDNRRKDEVKILTKLDNFMCVGRATTNMVLVLFC